MIKNRRFKILVSDTAPLYPPLWGGPIRIWNLYSGLPEEFQVTYVGPVFRFGAEYKETQIAPNLNEIAVPVTKLYHPFRWFEIKFLKGLTFELFSYLFMSLDFRFKRVLREQNADILIASHPWSFPCLKKTRKDQILIYDSHNCEYLLGKMITENRWYRHIVRMLIRFIERSACRKSDIIFACSKEDAKAFVELYGVSEHKIYLISNGTSIKRNTITEEEKMKIKIKIKKDLSIEKGIFFVGTFFNPNIEAAKFIIERLSEELDDCTFLVAGWVNMAFKDTIVPKNVRFLGRIDDQEMHRIMSACDIAINPMLNGSGVNIKLLDYLSFGLPVVTTPRGARGIEAINGQHLLIAETSNFGDIIKRLLSDKDLCHKLSVEGKKFVEEKFDWNKIRTKMVQILRNQNKDEISFYHHS